MTEQEIRNVNELHKSRWDNATTGCFIHENIMNGPDELRNTLFMFWVDQKYTSCKVLNDQNLWPPMEDHLASNEPPKQLTFLRSSRHILTSTEYKI